MIQHLKVKRYWQDIERLLTVLSNSKLELKVKGRLIELKTYPISMISDGIHDDISYENTATNLRMDGGSSSLVSSTMLYAEKRCESIYGFLPCADTMQEGALLMFMHAYLMMLGEEWIHKGSEALFMLIGDKAIGASLFRVLMALSKIVSHRWKEIGAPKPIEKPKATILYVVFSVGIMYLISGAFMQSVIQFSNAANIPFCFTSFVRAPLAMNTRMVIMALLNVGVPHVTKNASLTFSEMYNGLVMNKLLGLLSVLTTVYIKR